MNENKDWKYCVVGNIVQERVDADGILRHGTAAFRGGAKVFLCGKNFDFSGVIISALGLTRGKRLQVIDTPMEHIENLRVQKTYRTGILAIMNDWEFRDSWWGNTEEDKKDAETFIEEWNSRFVREKVMKKKYYPYSVKDCLKSFFGEDTVVAMRYHDYSKSYCCYDHERPVKHIPMCWRGADEALLDVLRENTFLTDTILTDDYIAYTLRRGTEDQVFLMFMTDEDNPSFRMEPEYARLLDTEWREKGFRPILIHVCVGATYHEKHRYSIRCGSREPEGVYFYTLRKVNGKDCIVFKYLACWEAVESKLATVTKTQDPAEYESLFDPGIRIMKGDKEISKGIDDTIRFFGQYGTAEPVLEKMRFSSMVYRRLMKCGEWTLNCHVNTTNLICRIDLEKWSGYSMPDDSLPDSGSILGQIPDATGIRPLDPVKMHALAVQISYVDGTVRNYYLKTFEKELVLPDECDVSGYTFNSETLRSVCLDDQQNAVFNNGFAIPRHILYSRSYRQVVAEKPDHFYGDPEGMVIRPICRLPIKNGTGRYAHYWGKPKEVYGPCEPWLDRDGNRVSDISVLYRDYLGYYDAIEAFAVMAEPTWKVGFLKKDGTWLAPPVFDDVEESNRDGCAIATTGYGDEQKKYLVCAAGAKEIDCEMYSIRFSPTLCPFNVMKDGESFIYWDPCNDLDSEPDIKFGKWGLMNQYGEVVVEPCYDIFHGFLEAWEHTDQYYAIVGKMNDHGDVLLGVIDGDGKEIIPCEYCDIHWRFGDTFIFRKTEEDKFGVMNFAGEVLSEQKFWRVYKFDEEHRMIVLEGTEDENIDYSGVYSLDCDELIIPIKYHSVEFEKTYIRCDNWDDSDYYDYEGHRICCKGMIRESDQDGVFEDWYKGKMQLIRWDGTIVSEPVDALWAPYQKDNVEDYNCYIFEKGEYKQEGLANTDGTILIPPVYNKVEIENGLVIATRHAESRNKIISEELYKTDGTPLLQGSFRYIRFPDLNDQNLITFYTPEGKEYCRISDPDSFPERGEKAR